MAKCFLHDLGCPNEALEGEFLCDYHEKEKNYGVKISNLATHTWSEETREKFHKKYGFKKKTNVIFFNALRLNLDMDSYKRLVEIIKDNKIKLNSNWDGNPQYNDLIQEIGKQHNVGLFESVNKLLIRSSLEKETTMELLFNTNLVQFEIVNSGDIYSINNISFKSFYKIAEDQNK